MLHLVIYYHQIILVHSLKVFLDSPLLKEQMAAMATFAQIRTSIATIHGLGGHAHDQSCLGHFTLGLLHYDVHGAVFEDSPEVKIGPDCSSSHYEYTCISLPVLHCCCVIPISSPFLSECKSKCRLLSLKSYMTGAPFAGSSLSTDTCSLSPD